MDYAYIHQQDKINDPNVKSFKTLYDSLKKQTKTHENKIILIPQGLCLLFNTVYMHFIAGFVFMISPILH